MGENFKKLKKRALIIRLLKSFFAGISIGTFTIGALMLLSKLKILMPRDKTYFIIGAAFALVTFIGFLLLLRAPDRALARKLDRAYGLKERIQTMLQYKNVDSAMNELQRNDANEALATVSKKSLGIKTLWVYILCAIIGAAVLTVSSLYTVKETPPPPEEVIPEEAFELTELQIAALEELITYVSESEMQSPYRESVASSLETLLSNLKSISTVREKNEAVYAAMDYILEQTDNSSYALELIVELWNSGSNSTKRLAETLNYYSWSKTDEWNKFSSQLSGFRTTFVHADSLNESPDQEKMVTETQLLLLKISSAIEIALTKSAIPESDALYTAMLRLAKADETNDNGTRIYGLSKLSEMIAENGYTGTQRELDSTVSALGSEIYKAIYQHKANTETGEYAVTRLSQIFDCEHPAFKRPQLREISDENTPVIDDENNAGVSGSIGSGTVYGSDDLVLDPYTNTYVEYGTILDKYYSLMFGKLQDGNYTDAEKEAMEKYFSILYGGFEETDEESQN